MSASSSRVVLIAMAMTVVVAGCGKKPEPAAAHPKIGMLLSSTQTNNAKQLGAGFAADAKLAGVEAVVDGPPINDPPRQAQMFKDLLGNAKGGIAIQASNPELIAGDLAKAVGDGTRLMAVDTKPAVTCCSSRSPSASRVPSARSTW
jgi:ABC-type sugar transport system substrate-binding protein